MKSVKAITLVVLMGLGLNAQAQVLPNEANTAEAFNRARPVCMQTQVGQLQLKQYEDAFAYLQANRSEFEPDTLLVHDADLNHSAQSLVLVCAQYIKYNR